MSETNKTLHHRSALDWHTLRQANSGDIALINTALRNSGFEGFDAWRLQQKLFPRNTPLAVAKWLGPWGRLAMLASQGTVTDVNAWLAEMKLITVAQAALHWPALGERQRLTAMFNRQRSSDLHDHFRERWRVIDQEVQAIRNQLDLLDLNHPVVRAVHVELNGHRMSLSLTHRLEQPEGQSILNWHSVNEGIMNGIQNGAPLSLDNIRQINAMLGFNANAAIGHVPQRFGEYRTEHQRAAADQRRFLSPEHIPAAMDDFMAWLSAALSTKLHPIHIAAQAYVRLVSIHPFPNANGRTARLVMNWILQAHGYPPASLHSRQFAQAVFTEGGNPDPGAAEEALTLAVDESIALIHHYLSQWRKHHATQVRP